MGQRPLKVGFHIPEVERIARWQDIAAMARSAEAIGFDSIWVPDHLLYKYEGKEPQGPWECWSILSAIAAVTSRVEIGPLVLCTNFRNPALIAKMADTVDEISGGRLILGLGAGWHEPEYEAFGFPYGQRFGRFAEAFGIIRTLLAEGKIDHQGKYFTLRECELRPRGPRGGGIPLMIGSKGEQIMRMTMPHAAYWNGWYTWSGNTPAGVQPFDEQIDAICQSAGRNPSEVQRTIAVFVRYPGGEFSENPDAPAISGTPEWLAEQLTGYAAAGISHVQVLMDPNTRESVERFGRVLEILDRG